MSKKKNLPGQKTPKTNFIQAVGSGGGGGEWEKPRKKGPGRTPERRTNDDGGLYGSVLKGTEREWEGNERGWIHQRGQSRSGKPKRGDRQNRIRDK